MRPACGRDGGAGAGARSRTVLDDLVDVLFTGAKTAAICAMTYTSGTRTNAWLTVQACSPKALERHVDGVPSGQEFVYLPALMGGQ